MIEALPRGSKPLQHRLWSAALMGDFGSGSKVPPLQEGEEESISSFKKLLAETADLSRISAPTCSKYCSTAIFVTVLTMKPGAISPGSKAADQRRAGGRVRAHARQCLIHYYDNFTYYDLSCIRCNTAPEWVKLM